MPNLTFPIAPSSPCMGIDHFLRIGLSTRVTKAEGYDELRDSLARDWTLFMAEHLPGALWQPLPNEGAAVLNRVEKWGLNGLILTGGNDIGEYPHKDATDRALFSFALAHHIPVLGVCRGLQVMAHFFGVPLERKVDGSHTGLRHRVCIRPSDSTGGWKGASQVMEVNSYHTFVVHERDILPPLEALALCDDGSIEALAVKGKPAFAVMWHPEREHTLDAFTAGVLKQLFKGR